MDRNLFHLVGGTAACVSPTGTVLVRLGPGEIFGEIRSPRPGPGPARPGPARSGPAWSPAAPP